MVSAYRSTMTPQPLFEAGKSFSMRLPMPSMSARACSRVTPSFSRANEISQWKSRVMFDALERERPPELNGSSIEGTPLRQNADDRVGLAVEQDGAVDDRSVGAELADPEHVTDHGDLVSCRVDLHPAGRSGRALARCGRP